MANETRDRRLHSLLKERREDLIELWTRRVASALGAAGLSNPELVDHIPAFVDDLTAALHPEAMPLPPSSHNCDEHGAQRLRLGFDVAEVVREYGLMHKSIIELARERDVSIDSREQETLAAWLNVGIATSVAEYVARRDAEYQRQSTEHLGFIAHEVRNPLAAARMALQLLRRSEGEQRARTLETADRNLRRAADVIDGVLTQAFLKLGVPPNLEPISLASLLDDVVADYRAEAEIRDITISAHVDEPETLRADRRLLRSAVTNLVHNAVKFSKAGTSVGIRTRRQGERVVIEVADSCGGLPSGRSEELFAPLVQKNMDRSGVGLGLAIARQAVEAHRGTIAVRNEPGVGCVFTIELPQAA
jgi:signal transduction histidine kinase